MRAMPAIVSVVTATLALAACGGDASAEAITVFAAASLTNAFADVADAFEDANPATSVTVNLAGSSSLREQILAGAPADVFASADESNMVRLVEAGEVAAPTRFATNRLQIVVPAGNPGGVAELEDFARSDLLIGLCAEAAPCGELGRQVLRAAGVTPALDTSEPDVRALLTKVADGELDTGIVYATDVISAGDRVEGIDIPPELDVVVSYPVGVVARSGNPAVASAFVEFLLGDAGQAILGEYGFGPP